MSRYVGKHRTKSIKIDFSKVLVLAIAMLIAMSGISYAVGVNASMREICNAALNGNLSNSDRAWARACGRVSAEGERILSTTPTPSPTSSPSPTISPTPTSSPSPSPTVTTSPTTSPPPSPSPNPTPTIPPPSSEWPGPNNTGVPNGTILTSYTGPCTITTANTVIDAKTINCDPLTVNTSGVVVKHSKLIGIAGSGYRVEDSTIDTTPVNPSNSDGFVRDGINGRSYVALRVNVFGSNRGVYCAANIGGQTTTIQDSWIHGTEIGASSASHASALRVEIGCNIIHNTLACDWLNPTPADGGCSADLTQYPDFNPVHHNNITGNLFVANTNGAAFCMYGGDIPSKPYGGDPSNATFIVVKDNVFQRGGVNLRCAAYGPVDSYNSSRTGNVWSNNKYDDGTIINSDGSSASLDATHRIGER